MLQTPISRITSMKKVKNSGNMITQKRKKERKEGRKEGRKKGRKKRNQRERG